MPLISSRTISAFLTALLVLACDRDRPLPHADTAGARSPTGVATPALGAQRKDTPPALVRGDTFELVNIPPADQPSKTRDRSACSTEAGRYSAERIVFSTDSTYESFAVLRPECWDTSASSSDTLQIDSVYRLHGDTLTLYTGDGNEIYESGRMLIVGDSLVPIYVDPTDLTRLVRRRHPTP